MCTCTSACTLHLHPLKRGGLKPSFHCNSNKIIVGCELRACALMTSCDRETTSSSPIIVIIVGRGGGDGEARCQQLWLLQRGITLQLSAHLSHGLIEHRWPFCFNSSSHEAVAAHLLSLKECFAHGRFFFTLLSALIRTVDRV